MQDRNLDETWTCIQDTLRATFSDTVYQVWLASLRPLALERGVLYVSAPRRTCEWIRRRFGPTLVASAAASSSVSRVELVAEGDSPPNPSRTESPAPVAPRLSHSFGDFVIGPGNRFAHAAALAVAELPGHAYNPLIVCGPAGVGKTHLLQAIAAYIQEHSRRVAIQYTTVERFTNDFLAALRHDQLEAFKRAYRHNDVLLLDDAQFLDGKARTAEEFFHTLDAAISAGAQVVISIDRHPSSLPSLEQRLRQRLESGLLVDLVAPDASTRIAILRKLAASHPGAEIDLGVIDHLASRIVSNVRALEGALTRLVAYGSLTGRPITLELADEVLTNLYDWKPQPPQGSRRRLSVPEIQAETAAILDVDAGSLTSHRRGRRLVYARQVAMYLARELTDLSLPAIAQQFGGRDHTTVLHAHRKVKQMMLADTHTRDVVPNIINRLSQIPHPSTHGISQRDKP